MLRFFIEIVTNRECFDSSAKYQRCQKSTHIAFQCNIFRIAMASDESVFFQKILNARRLDIENKPKTIEKKPRPNPKNTIC